MDWKGEDQRSVGKHYSLEVKMREHLVGTEQKGQMQGIYRRESQLDIISYLMYSEIKKGTKHNFAIG